VPERQHPGSWAQHRIDGTGEQRAEDEQRPAGDVGSAGRDVQNVGRRCAARFTRKCLQRIGHAAAAELNSAPNPSQTEAAVHIGPDPAPAYIRVELISGGSAASPFRFANRLTGHDRLRGSVDADGFADGRRAVEIRMRGGSQARCPDQMGHRLGCLGRSQPLRR
jgi:hypothetical protein